MNSDFFFLENENNENNNENNTNRISFPIFPLYSNSNVNFTFIEPLRDLPVINVNSNYSSDEDNVIDNEQLENTESTNNYPNTYPPRFPFSNIIVPTTNNLFNSFTNSNNSILFNSLYENESFKNVLSEKGKKELIHRKYDKKTDLIKHCPILFTEFETDQDIVELPCKHIFDKEAIIKWLENENATCPVCRINLDSKEIRNNDSDNTPNPTISPLITPRQLMSQVINNAEERLLQRAIEESLNNN